MDNLTLFQRCAFVSSFKVFICKIIIDNNIFVVIVELKYVTDKGIKKIYL